MTYGGQTYGIPTDGNVHIQYMRKDLIENPDNKKRFADKYGKELKVPARPGRRTSASRSSSWIRRRTSTAPAVCATAQTARPGGT